MNYRHHFHAGNFADVMKHALLVQLVRAMQKKEKGFLYLDTHAGRGGYNLMAAGRGDSLLRRPEWPDGIGRLTERADLPEIVSDYVALTLEFDQLVGGAASPKNYPGSPWLALRLARKQDRLALCERHPEEFAALTKDFSRAARVGVHEMDGYEAVRAMLPPPEKRALVLIDPPYEAQDEHKQIVAAIDAGLRRLPAGVFAIWYPVTPRVPLDEFFGELKTRELPPALRLELAIAGAESPMKMKGCGLLVLNPPWQFDHVAKPMLEFLAQTLAQAPGGGARAEWLVPEK